MELVSAALSNDARVSYVFNIYDKAGLDEVELELRRKSRRKSAAAAMNVDDGSVYEEFFESAVDAHTPRHAATVFSRSVVPTPKRPRSVCGEGGHGAASSILFFWPGGVQKKTARNRVFVKNRSILSL